MIVLAFSAEEFSALTLALQVYLNHCEELKGRYRSADGVSPSVMFEIYERRVEVVARMQDTVLKARAS